MKEQVKRRHRQTIYVKKERRESESIGDCLDATIEELEKYSKKTQRKTNYNSQ